MIRVVHLGPARSAQGGIAAFTDRLVAFQRQDPDLAVEFIPTLRTQVPWRKTLAFAVALARLAAALWRRPYPILHVHSSFANSFLRKALLIRIGKAARRPVIVHVHGSKFDQWYEGLSSARRKAVSQTLDRADAIIALSNSWKHFLCGITRTPIEVIYNAVPVGRFRFERIARDRRATFLYLGYIGERKGAYDLLEAARRLEQRGVVFRLILAGNGEVEAARSWVSRHRMGPAIEILGWVNPEDRHRLLETADVFVLPSHNEGLPMAMLEAMASGLAILTTPVGGIPEALTDGVEGKMVAPGDVEALASAMERLVRDPGERRRLGEEARKTAERRFDIAGNADRLKRIYLRISRAG